ncbi:MAG: 2-phosphosulfolactate phosphatase [Nocardioidaceae bacterium]
MTLHPAHLQEDFQLRFDWGARGAAAVAPGADVVVVVDVLSFTTTVTVAVERGIEVCPYPWRDASAEEHAAAHGAVLAAGRREGLQRGRVSLSPASLTDVEGIERIVLPSPNGAAITVGLAREGATVVAACLRNAPAVARWLSPRLAAGETVALVAAGERWPDDSLRPAVEDLWGAGAVVAALSTRHLDDASPEARVAAAAYRGVKDDLMSELVSCASGAELVGDDFLHDVAIAGEVGASDVVPVLRHGFFVAATRLGP